MSSVGGSIPIVLVLEAITGMGVCVCIWLFMCPVLLSVKEGHIATVSFKASQMGHFVMVSLWYVSLSTNTRFGFLYFRMNNC